MKRALIVGVDEYDNYSSLGGCVNDANALDPLLARNEDNSPNFDTQKRVSDHDDVTRDSLLEDLEALLRGGADVALFYFAGHGTQLQSDVAIVLKDGTGTTPGIALSEILGKVANSQVKEVIIILDCCFAGAAGGTPQLGNTFSTLKEGVTILAASRPDQTAEETANSRGAFSTYLCGALEGGAAEVLGKVTLAGIYAYLEESFGAWDQRPVFKANVDHLFEVRGCKPAVPVEDLRELPTLFSEPDRDYDLDPSFEDTEPGHDQENVKNFKLFQRLRAAKLLEPVDEDHLYFAAMNSKACRLTPLGKHYWKMAERGLI